MNEALNKYGKFKQSRVNINKDGSGCGGVFKCGANSLQDPTRGR